MRQIYVVVALGFAIYGCVGASVWRRTTVPQDSHVDDSNSVHGGVGNNVDWDKLIHGGKNQHDSNETSDHDWKSDEDANQGSHVDAEQSGSGHPDLDESHATDLPEPSTEVDDCSEEPDDLSKFCASNIKRIHVVGHPTVTSDYVVCSNGSAQVHSCAKGKVFNNVFNWCWSKSVDLVLSKVNHGDVKINVDWKKWLALLAHYVDSNEVHDHHNSQSHNDTDCDTDVDSDEDLEDGHHNASDTELDISACASVSNRLCLVAHPIVSKYVVCINGSAHVQSCTKGKVFNDAFSKCLSKSHNQAICNLTNAEIDVSAVWKRWISWIVDNAKAKEHSHNDSHEWDEDSSWEDHPNTLYPSSSERPPVSHVTDVSELPTTVEDCNEEPEDLSKLCASDTKRIHLVAHPTVTSNYVVCFKGSAHVRRCANGKVFNDASSRCSLESSEV